MSRKLVDSIQPRCNISPDSIQGKASSSIDLTHVGHSHADVFDRNNIPNDNSHFYERLPRYGAWEAAQLNQAGEMPRSSSAARLAGQSVSKFEALVPLIILALATLALGSFLLPRAPVAQKPNQNHSGAMMASPSPTAIPSPSATPTSIPAPSPTSVPPAPIPRSSNGHTTF